MIFFLLTLSLANSDFNFLCLQDGNCDLACNKKSMFYDFGDCNGCSPGCIDSLLNNGHCEPECFKFECSYDYLDCFNNCNEKCNEDFIGDGTCDFDCNTESCGFDGGDCNDYCSDGCLISQTGDGFCDTSCLTQECQLDLGDCDKHLYISQNSTGDGSETSPFGSIENSLNSIFSEGLYYLHLSPGIHYLTKTIFFEFPVGLVIVGNKTEIRTHNISSGFVISNLKYFSVLNVDFDGSEMFELNCAQNDCMYIFYWECSDDGFCKNFIGDSISKSSLGSLENRDICSSTDSLIIFSLVNVENSYFHDIKVKRFGHLGSLVKASNSGLEIVNVSFFSCEIYSNAISALGPVDNLFKRLVNMKEERFSPYFQTPKVVIKSVSFNEINSKNSNLLKYLCLDPLLFQGILLERIENALIDNITFNRVITNNKNPSSLIFLFELSQFSVSNIHISNSSLININVLSLTHLPNFLAIGKAKSIINGVFLSDSEFFDNILVFKLNTLTNDLMVQNIHLTSSILKCYALINTTNDDVYKLPASIKMNNKQKVIDSGSKLRISSVYVSDSEVSLKLFSIDHNFDVVISNITILKTLGLYSGLASYYPAKNLDLCTQTLLPGSFFFKENKNLLLSHVQLSNSVFDSSVIEISSLEGLHAFTQIEIADSRGNFGFFVDGSSRVELQLNNLVFSNVSYENSAIFSENIENIRITNSVFLKLSNPAINLKSSQILISTSIFENCLSLLPLVTLEPLSYSSKILVESCSFRNNSGSGPADVFVKSLQKLESEIVFKSTNFSLTSAKSPTSLATDPQTALKLIKFENCSINSIISTNCKNYSDQGIFNFNMIQGQVTFVDSFFYSNKNSVINSPVVFFNSENSDVLSFINCEITSNLNDMFLLHRNPNVLQKSFWKSLKFTKNHGKIFSLENSLASFEDSEFSFNSPEVNLIAVSQYSVLTVVDSLFTQNTLKNKGSLLEFALAQAINLTRVVFKNNDCQNRALVSALNSKSIFDGLVTNYNKMSSVFKIDFSETQFKNISIFEDESEFVIIAESSSVVFEKSRISDISSFVQARKSNLSLSDVELKNITFTLFDLDNSSIIFSSVSILFSPGYLKSISSSLIFSSLNLNDSLSISTQYSKISFINSQLSQLNSLELLNSELFITSSDLKQGKTTILVEKSKTFIRSSNFSNFQESVFQVFNSSFRCENCNFFNNSGNKGSSIFSSSSEIFLNSSSFENNQALQGGAIFYSESLVVDPNCSYRNNQAVHGQDKATPLNIIIPQFSNSYNQVSGESFASLSFLLKDSLNQTIFSDNSTSFEFQPLNTSAVLKGPKTLVSNQGTVDAEDLTIFIDPGTSSEFLITSTDSSLSLYFNLSFRECFPGEVLSRENTCKVCENNTYSLDVNDQYCRACPSSAVCKGKNLIFPAAGFWSDPLYPENFYPCSNSKACVQGFEGMENNCAFSYTGTLCGNCLPGFKMKGSYNCTKCPEYWISWLIVSVAGLIIAGLISFMVFSNIKNTNKPKSEIALLLKILVNYCQTIIVLASIDLKWPSSILYLFDFSTAVGESSSQVINLSCSELSSSSDSFVSSNAVTALFPFLLIGFIFFIWTITGALKKTSRYIKVHFVSTCVVVVILFHTSVSNSILSIFSCKKINDDYWNTSNLSTKCFTGSHMKALLYIGVPGLVIWCLSVPLIIFSSLFFHRNDLQEVNTMIKYKMLFGGYKKDFYYWEMLTMLRKFLIRVVAILLISSGITIQGLGIMVILIFSLTLHVNFRPYEKESINKLERYCIILLILYSCGGIVFSTEISEDTKIVIGWLLFILNLCFLMYWFKFFLNSVFSILKGTKLFNRLKEKILLRKKCKISINNEEGVKMECTYKSNHEELADKSIEILCPKNPYNSFMENENPDHQPRLNVWTVNQID